MLTLSELWIYPVKSLGGISISQSEVEERGLRYDRRWMIVDESGVFVTQRSVHSMALIDVAFSEGGFSLTHRSHSEKSLFLPFQPVSKKVVQVRVWDDELPALSVSDELDSGLSEWFGRSVRLVLMPESSQRLVDPRYAKHNETVSFADGYPVLLIGQSSLDTLNAKLEEPVSMKRFRPNLVITGSEPFAEDSWTNVRIGTAEFLVVKPCARCVLTTVDPLTGETGSEPLKTLATFRKQGNKILFGQNLLPLPGQLAVGDTLRFS
ncbi:MOSC domain-containing protein [Arundinibacter roseus]|uniref:MOSC domain-containing protein n=1 Tax=Arundinibacter roseus TaxID=2070510 RepID=A0A4R4KJM8_9BACT|nr:MOSC N-terminal beta barrel domain-containing protein [Arundinibacter roseus]TDB68173.1 MOSC domain-containing protein [Arundinibacter roseus]